MATYDRLNSLHTAPLIPPGTVITNANTAIVSSILDTAGFNAVTLAIISGALTDANATFAVTLEHGDDSALADTAAPATTDLVGTLALAGFTFANDNVTRKIGYVGSKRYLRLTITPSGNDAGAAEFAALAILERPRNAPTANPPQ